MGRSLESLARSSARTELMQQMIHNHSVQVDGDRGTGFAYQEGRGVFHGVAYVYGGRYDDVYVKTEQGWRFKSRTHMLTATQAEVSRGSKPAPPAGK